MKFNLVCNYPPGDCWCLTRIVRDFAEQFPEDVLAPVVPCPEIFSGNPFYRVPDRDAVELNFTFPGAVGKNRDGGNADKIDSMVKAMFEFVRRETGRPLEMRCSAPEFYPSPDEKRYSPVPTGRPVCVLNAGWKSDTPAKFWGRVNFESVVHVLSDRILFVQVGAARSGIDFHRPVPGALDLLGRTTLRELAQLVYHADFVLTGISQLHHLAGIACYKPRHCVTIAGGREPENWANCHARPGVTWHWMAGKAVSGHCFTPDASWHDSPGCRRHDCADPVCMKSIRPGEIIQLFKRILDHEKN